MSVTILEPFLLNLEHGPKTAHLDKLRLSTSFNMSNAVAWFRAVLLNRVNG